MATASSSETLAVAGWDHDDTKSDRYLAARLAAAGADFKGVAAVTFILAAAMAALVWLAVGVVAEHWVVPGGLSTAARWAWLVVGLFALGAALIRWILPLVRYRVNLLYAARVIEHEHPELLNDLVNAVLVKAHPEASSQLVVRALERRAAKRLSGVPADGVADRAIPLRLAVALATLVACLCLYQLFAPKSLAVSALRMVVPWLDVAAPARVSIAPLRLTWRVPPGGAGAQRPAQPLDAVAGTVTLVRGRQLVVETDITGLRAGERPILEVTPLHDDGTVEEAEAWQSPLAATAGPGRMTAVVPDAARGLERSVEFVVVAGDARSGRIRVAVVDTPTLLVREVRYDYPPYTGRAPETVAWEGDLRAPEFTKVTITAESNGPLEGAWIDPGCSGRDSEKKRMRVGQHDLSRAIGEFPLRLKADRTAPEFSSYRLVLQPKAAAGSREPPIPEKLEHRVEVIADLAPEVSIEAPAEGLHVPPSAPVAIQVRAVDPDYGLARVGVEMRIKGGRDLGKAWLLDRPHAGEFNGVHQIELERIGVAGGGVVEYRAVAEDTRPESPNKVESPWRTLTIDAAAPAPPLPPRQAPPDGNGGQGGMPQGGGQVGGNQGGGGQPGGDKTGEKQSGGDRSSDGRSEPGDPRRDPGMQPGSQDGRSDGAAKQPEPRDNGAKRDGSESPEQGGQRGGQQGGREPQPGTAPGGQGQSRQPAQTSPGQRGAGGGQGGNRGTQQDRGRGEPQAGGQADGRGAKAAGGDRMAAQPASDRDAIERLGQRAAEQPPQVRRELVRNGERKERHDARGSFGDDMQGQDDSRGGPKSIDEREVENGDGERKQELEGTADKLNAKKQFTGDGEFTSKLEEGKTAETGRVNVDAKRVSADVNVDNEANIDMNRTREEPSTSDDATRINVENTRISKTESLTGDIHTPPGQPGEPGKSTATDVNLKDAELTIDRKIDGQPGQKPPPGKNEAPGEKQEPGEPGAPQPQQLTNKPPQSPDAPCRNPDGTPCDKPASGSSGAPLATEGGSGGDGKTVVGSGEVASSASATSAVATGGAQSGDKSRTGVDLTSAKQVESGMSMISSGDPNRAHGGMTTNGIAVGSGGGGLGRDLTLQRLDAQQPRPMEWLTPDAQREWGAVDLAIKHLRDDMNAGRGDVLDELGWTPAQARAFIERWESMQRLAAGGDEKKRGEFERALRSLGLRPDQVVTSRDVPAAARGGQAQGRRGRPPAAYREQFEAYQRAAGTE